MNKFIIIFSLIVLPSNLLAEKIKPFTLKNYANEDVFDISKIKKKTVLNFWATWCTSCIKEIDELEALKKSYPQYNFIAVSAGDSKKEIKRFLKKNPWTYQILMDSDKTISKGLGVLNLPQTWVIDEKGEVVYKETTPPKTLP